MLHFLNRPRIIDIAGRQFVSQGLSRRIWDDVYHRALTVSWPVFFGLAAAAFLLLNTLFAGIYQLGTQPIANQYPHGFAGAFFATRQGFISPESFTFQESALVLAIVVLGGMGSQLGVALAALAMIGGFELFRGFDQYRMLVFGAVMVLLMIWRPRGLVGHRSPTVFLEHNRAISSDLVKEGHG